MEHQEIDGRIAIRVADFLERYISKVMSNLDTEDTLFMCLELFDISREIHRSKGAHWTEVSFNRNMGIQILSALTSTPIEDFTEEQHQQINSRGIDYFLDDDDILFYSRNGRHVSSSRGIRRAFKQNYIRIGILQKIVDDNPDAIIFLT